MQARLMEHVLFPQTWIPQAKGNIHVARYYQHRLEPVAFFSSLSYTESFLGRLLLLAQPEWELLGLAVSLTPHLGKLQNTMDGAMRQTMKSYLSEEQIVQLDHLSKKVGALTEEEVKSVLPRSAWKSRGIVFSGISSIKAFDEYTPSQKEIISIRFEEASPSVTGLNPTIVEELCKILFPNLTWLV